jgi:hypothetical protein
LLNFVQVAGFIEFQLRLAGCDYVHIVLVSRFANTADIRGGGHVVFNLRRLGMQGQNRGPRVPRQDGIANA